MSDSSQKSFTGANLRDDREEFPMGDTEEPSDSSELEDAAFRKASKVVDPEKIDYLDGKRKHPLERLALPPDDVELATAIVKLRARQQDVKLKRMLALFAVVAVSVQLLVADLILMRWIVFGETAPSDGVLVAWMSATVVEVIGIVAIVARNLFPGKPGKGKAPSN